MNQDSGKFIIFIGIAVVFIGIIWYFFGNKLGFLGHLPGDIRIKRDNFSFYFPITTMILLSLILNLIFKLFGNR
ncbi:MAG: DUF2905 domain-containing protein [Lewinellaceae bacterium]|nr:DUF2905 domain-containing protein [Lewinellaceae bacterium]